MISAWHRGMKILDHLPVELSVSEGSWVAACLTGFLLSIYETDWMNMHKGPIKKNGMYLGADFLSFVSSKRAREVLRRIMMCIEQGHWFVNPLVKKIPCKKKTFPWTLLNNHPRLRSWLSLDLRHKTVEALNLPGIVCAGPRLKCVVYTVYIYIYIMYIDGQGLQ